MESEKKEKEIKVDGQTAFNLKLIDFDYKIAESEAVTADLKKQKLSFIRETAMQEAINMFDNKEK